MSSRLLRLLLCWLMAVILPLQAAAGLGMAVAHGALPLEQAAPCHEAMADADAPAPSSEAAAASSSDCARCGSCCLVYAVEAVTPPLRSVERVSSAPQALPQTGASVPAPPPFKPPRA